MNFELNNSAKMNNPSNNGDNHFQQQVHQQQLQQQQQQEQSRQQQVPSEFQQEDSEFRDGKELSCYESSVNCCGDFWGSLRAWCPCIFCCCPYPYSLITYSNIGLLQKFGQYQKSLPAGLHKINPCTEQVIIVNMKTVVLQLDRQIVITKDNITADIDTIAFYRIIDPTKSTYKLKNVSSSVKEIIYATLRTICGEYTLQDLLEKRQHVADEIERFVDKAVKDWGIFVEQVFIQDMVLSQELQSQLSMVTKTKRIAESTIISAKADVESAKLFRQAAQLLDSQAAMQIRYLETLQGIGQSPSSKLMFFPLHNEEEEIQKQ